MVNDIDLKQLEKKAFRAAHQDGLWDIYIGGVAVSMAVLGYSDASEAFPLLRFGLFLAGLGLSYLIYWGGKRFLIIPRLGQVKFGPKRQKRKATLVIVLCGIVLIQLIILAGTIVLWGNPNMAASLGFTHTARDSERLVVAIIGALFVGPSTAVIAYFNDYLRGYFIALILSLAVFALIWFGQPAFLIAAGLVIMVPGVILFIRFLRDHPLPPAEAIRD
jgi:hypothetical protein